MVDIRRYALPEGDLRGKILSFFFKNRGKSFSLTGVEQEEISFVPFRGRSMLPGLKEGDILAVLPLRESDNLVGEIVLRKKDEKTLIAHRITDFYRTAGMVRTRGDSWPFYDQRWNISQGVGRVVAVWRDNRLLKPPKPPSWIKRYMSIAYVLINSLFRRLRN